MRVIRSFKSRDRRHSNKNHSSKSQGEGEDGEGYTSVRRQSVQELVRITANQLLEFFKKYWVYLVLFLAVLIATTILDRFVWCNLVTVKNVTQCTVMGQSSWEWIKLLIGPVLVAIIGIFLNRFFKIRDNKQSEKEREIDADRLRQEKLVADERRKQEKAIEADRLRQNALIDYFDQMTQLFLSKEWPKPSENSEKTNKSSTDLPIIALAKARTFAVLNELDGRRKGSLVIFLYESKALQHISLEKSNLREASLNETSLSDINLSGADLRAARLSGTNLNGAILSKAILSGADLRAAKLRAAELIGIFLNEARVKRADLRKAKLNGALMIKAKIEGADLREANLHGAFLSEADLIGADLRAANLSAADLSGAKLSGAKLSGADLTDANLNGAELIAAKPRQDDLKVSQTPGIKLIAPYQSDAEGITINQIKKARHWDKALYSDEFRKELGLPRTPSPEQSQEKPE